VLLAGEADLLDEDDLVADLLVLRAGEVAALEEDLLLVLLVEEAAFVPVELLLLVTLEEVLVLPVVRDLLTVFLEGAFADCLTILFVFIPWLKGGQ